MEEITYSVLDKKKLSYSLVLEFFKSNDEALVPRISERVDLSDYSRKIAERATLFVALKDEILVGVFALYFNRYPDNSYCPYFCVNTKYRGKHIGNNLINRAFDYCRENGSLCMQLTVSEENLSAIKFYKKNKFKFINSNFYSGSYKKYFLLEKQIG